MKTRIKRIRFRGERYSIRADLWTDYQRWLFGKALSANLRLALYDLRLARKSAWILRDGFEKAMAEGLKSFAKESVL